MKRFRLRAAIIVIVVLAAVGAAVPAFALEMNPDPGMTGTELHAAPQQAPASDSDALHTRSLWAVLGVAIGCAIFGGFYLARKRAGHFDNPTWTAPISKMYSKDFPESFGDAPADPHDSQH
jgi:hypothetical protein